MMTAARACAPKTQKPRPVATGRGIEIHFNSGTSINSLRSNDLQPGRIIAMHWLRNTAGCPADG
jgi:hypothetical protein